MQLEPGAERKLTSVRRSSGPRGARPLSTRVGGLCGFGHGRGCGVHRSARSAGRAWWVLHRPTAAVPRDNRAGETGDRGGCRWVRDIGRERSESFAVGTAAQVARLDVRGGACNERANDEEPAPGACARGHFRRPALVQRSRVRLQTSARSRRPGRRCDRVAGRASSLAAALGIRLGQRQRSLPGPPLLPAGSRPADGRTGAQSAAGRRPSPLPSLGAAPVGGVVLSGLGAFEADRKRHDPKRSTLSG